MNEHDNLPPLPESFDTLDWFPETRAYTADQMREYALAALADAQIEGDPEAWKWLADTYARRRAGEAASAGRAGGWRNLAHPTSRRLRLCNAENI